MISAKIIADSIESIGNNRLTALEVVMPRYILAELNTHRMLSKNSASSRAIPFKKMVKSIQENPFIPIAWQKDHKGMQGIEYLTSQEDIDYAIYNWKEAGIQAIKFAKSLNSRVTKQLCNRLLEPFMWHTVLISGTDEGWENFFSLRCPQYLHEGSGTTYRSKRDYKDRKFEDYSDLDEATDNDTRWFQINKGQADIHMMALAESIWDAINESIPNKLNPGEYHIPFGDNIQPGIIRYSEEYASGKYKNQEDTINGFKVKIATARCARLSYQTLGEEPKIDYEKDINLYNLLLKSGHMSPFEHCARVMTQEEYDSYYGGKLEINQYCEYDYSNRYSKELKEVNVLQGNRYDNNYGWCRNFKGFIQQRELIENL